MKRAAERVGKESMYDILVLVLPAVRFTLLGAR